MIEPPPDSPEHNHYQDDRGAPYFYSDDSNDGEGSQEVVIKWHKP